MTSYWGLRDYGTGLWDGGDPDCDHKQTVARTADESTSRDSHGSATVDSDKGAMNFRGVCGKCGARRQDPQLGLEATPDEYVAAMVDVFREVRRVLKPWGTCWINLGDSYAKSPPGANRDTLHRSSGLHGIGSQRYRDTLASGTNQKRNTIVGGLKPKDLCGIPWRVAFALQDAGWYLRSDIIWAKPNPMPESVTDRPTKAHEYLFLLAKQPRYYFDQEAVREPATEGTDLGLLRGRSHDDTGMVSWAAPSIAARQEAGVDSRNGNPSGRRNIRSVWTIPTQPYPNAHFATFPVAIPERCILAGTSERGVCPECGKPWERVVERESNWQERREAGAWAGNVGVSDNYQNNVHGAGMSHDLGGGAVRFLGWRPSCGCYDQSGQSYDRNVIPAEAVSIPSVILDPFAGAGTTAVAARKHARRSILIELNEDYCQLIADRLAQQSLLTEGIA